MKVIYDHVYAVYFRSYRDNQEHFHTLHTDETMALLEAKLHNENERDGYWHVITCWWDDAWNQWRKLEVD